MKGLVLDYSIQRNSGVISADNGERYKFEGAEWQADTQPTRGASVDFDIENGMAVGIYRSLGSSVGRSSSKASPSRSSGGASSKSKTTAAMLALFLGGVSGAHKFYVGAWGWGIVYLSVFLLSWIFMLVLAAGESGAAVIFLFLMYIPGIASFVEFIRYLVLSEDDWDEKFSEESITPFTFIW